MKYIIFIFLLNLSFQFSLRGQMNWELTVEKNNIKVYTSNVPDSKIKAFKAHFTSNKSTTDLLEILKDYDNYFQWVSNCSESRIVDKISENEFFIYSVADSPWPFSDRDNVTRSSINVRKDGSVRIDLLDFPKMLPEEKDRIRVPKMEGFWDLTPLPNGKTKIIYMVMADPGGSLPAWLVNQFLTDSPLETITNLESQ